MKQAPSAAPRGLSSQIDLRCPGYGPSSSTAAGSSMADREISVPFKTMLVSTWRRLLVERAQAGLVIASTSSQYG